MFFTLYFFTINPEKKIFAGIVIDLYNIHAIEKAVSSLASKKEEKTETKSPDHYD